MTIAQNDSAFIAGKPALAGLPTFPAGRTPLNVAAARVAHGLKHRIVSATFLAAFARLADIAALALTSLAIWRLYVVPIDGFQSHYLIATALLPLATIVLIGSFKGYTVAAYRRMLPEIGRAAGLWTAVFGCLTLVLFFLRWEGERP